MKRYEPATSDGHMPAAVIGRVDTLEVRLDGLARSAAETQTSVEALGRGVTALSETLRTPGTPSGQTEGSGGEESEGQRDWLDPRLAPDTAARWLADLHRWVSSTLVWLTDRPLLPCWPWHPAAVVDLLALQDVHQTAYAGESPVAVADLLGRWLPCALDRVRREVGCDPHTHYLPDDRACRIEVDHLDAYAAWWAGDRTGTPPGLHVRSTP